MGARQRLATTAQGRAVLVKHADAGEDADRLAREAALLRACRHPGVVEVLDDRESDDGSRELSLAVAGSRTVTDLRTDLTGAAGLVAALATTVADLHDLGVVHGRITADHVVVDAGGRPVLCGFAGAGRAGSQPPGAPAPLEPADDVAALGALLGGLVAPDGGRPLGDWEPIPERRLGRRDRWTGFVRRSLLTLADQASADDPARRPTARALAASVLAALPAARLPVASDGRTPTASGEQAPSGGADVARPACRPGGRWRTAVAPLAAAGGLGLVVFGAAGLLRPASGPVPAPVAPEQGRQAPSQPATSPPPTAAPTTAQGASGCPLVTAPAADPDGDGCASPVAIADGVVEIDGVRYGVGRPGDLLAVGDWDCDGAATVALVRPDGGAVFVFDGWAAVGADAVATAVATVNGAAALGADDPDGDGCVALVVTDAAGSRTEVPT